MLPVQVEGETVATNATELPYIDGLGLDQIMTSGLFTLWVITPEASGLLLLSPL
jgi:hypothetical protein